MHFSGKKAFSTNWLIVGSLSHASIPLHPMWPVCFYDLSGVNKEELEACNACTVAASYWQRKWGEQSSSAIRQSLWVCMQQPPTFLAVFILLPGDFHPFSMRDLLLSHSSLGFVWGYLSSPCAKLQDRLCPLYHKHRYIYTDRRTSGSQRQTHTGSIADSLVWLPVCM